MKYSQQDKARILKITTRTLQRWKTSKPELYAIIEAGFKMRAVNPNFKITDRFNFDAVITQNAVKFNPIIIKTAVSQNAK